MSENTPLPSRVPAPNAPTYNAPDRVASWADLLRRLAHSALAGDPVSPGAPQHARLAFAQTFRDETGARPGVVDPFLADLLRLAPPELPQDAAPDVLLWDQLARGRLDPSELIHAEGGPLLGAASDTRAIEVRTEGELIALHALSEIAFRGADHALHERCRAAARWHLDEIQPDNATNHPWAIQVFVRLSLDGTFDRADEARLHAQTMLHNCMVSLGRPDRLSACILLHAARSLERHRAVDGVA